MIRRTKHGRIERVESLAALLDQPSGRLVTLRRRLAELDRLREALAGSLQEGFASECRLVNLDRERVVYACRNAAWATRLRYHEPQVCAAVQRLLGGELRRLVVRVVLPVDHGQTVPDAPLPTLGSGAAEAIERAAGTIDDPGISDALRRFVQRARRSPRR
jgi:hypothetical protein